MSIPTHRDDLIRVWRNEHRRNRLCSRCGEPVTTTALVDLAYTFEPCSCSEAPYTHLTETCWHRQCLIESGRSS